MVSTTNFDPSHKSTGENTVLKKVYIPAGQIAAVLTIQHGLGWKPSWVRTTPLARKTPPNGDWVATASDAVCQAIIQAEPIDPKTEPAWETSYFGPTESIATHLSFAVQNDAVGAVDAVFLVEIGRTHSSVK